MKLYIFLMGICLFKPTVSCEKINQKSLLLSSTSYSELSEWRSVLAEAENQCLPHNPIKQEAVELYCNKLIKCCIDSDCLSNRFNFIRILNSLILVSSNSALHPWTDHNHVTTQLKKVVDILGRAKISRVSHGFISCCLDFLATTSEIENDTQINQNQHKQARVHYIRKVITPLCIQLYTSYIENITDPAEFETQWNLLKAYFIYIAPDINVTDFIQPFITCLAGEKIRVNADIINIILREWYIQSSCTQMLTLTQWLNLYKLTYQCIPGYSNYIETTNSLTTMLYIKTCIDYKSSVPHQGNHAFFIMASIIATAPEEQTHDIIKFGLQILPGSGITESTDLLKVFIEKACIHYAQITDDSKIKPLYASIIAKLCIRAGEIAKSQEWYTTALSLCNHTSDSSLVAYVNSMYCAALIKQYNRLRSHSINHSNKSIIDAQLLDKLTKVGTAIKSIIAALVPTIITENIVDSRHALIIGKEFFKILPSTEKYTNLLLPEFAFQKITDSRKYKDKDLFTYAQKFLEYAYKHGNKSAAYHLACLYNWAYIQYGVDEQGTSYIQTRDNWAQQVFDHNIKTAEMLSVAYGWALEYGDAQGVIKYADSLIKIIENDKSRQGLICYFTRMKGIAYSALAHRAHQKNDKEAYTLHLKACEFFKQSSRYRYKFESKAWKRTINHNMLKDATLHLEAALKNKEYFAGALDCLCELYFIIPDTGFDTIKRLMQENIVKGAAYGHPYCAILLIYEKDITNALPIKSKDITSLDETTKILNTYDFIPSLVKNLMSKKYTDETDREAALEALDNFFYHTYALAAIAAYKYKTGTFKKWVLEETENIYDILHHIEIILPIPVPAQESTQAEQGTVQEPIPATHPTAQLLTFDQHPKTCRERIFFKFEYLYGDNKLITELLNVLYKGMSEKSSFSKPTERAFCAIIYWRILLARTLHQENYITNPANPDTGIPLQKISARRIDSKALYSTLEQSIKTTLALIATVTDVEIIRALKIYIRRACIYGISSSLSEHNYTQAGQFAKIDEALGSVNCQWCNRNSKDMKAQVTANSYYYTHLTEYKDMTGNNQDNTEPINTDAMQNIINTFHHHICTDSLARNYDEIYHKLMNKN
ncbi:hypothetical protein KG892_03540 [Vermiphilus pyriformis]|nr:MAG: hypothetical protein KG892_03540 [Vermiphilus pyriformis]